MLGENAVLFCHHGVNGVPQFVSHGGNVICLALVVEQHPGGQVWTKCRAEGTAHFALAHFAVHVSFIENPMCQFGELVVEALKSLEGHGSRFIVVIALVRFAYRGINVVAAQFFHADLASLEFKIAVENANILACDLEQGVDHLIWQVVDSIAHRDRAGESTQSDVFVLPVSNDVLIDLPQYA